MVQPQPLMQVQQDKEGKLLPLQRAQPSRAQLLEAAMASGWTPGESCGMTHGPWGGGRGGGWGTLLG